MPVTPEGVVPLIHSHPEPHAETWLEHLLFIATLQHLDAFTLKEEGTKREWIQAYPHPQPLAGTQRIRPLSSLAAHALENLLGERLGRRPPIVYLCGEPQERQGSFSAHVGETSVTVFVTYEKRPFGGRRGLCPLRLEFEYHHAA